jgi:hypothetical protein
VEKGVGGRSPDDRQDVRSVGGDHAMAAPPRAKDDRGVNHVVSARHAAELTRFPPSLIVEHVRDPRRDAPPP